MLLVAASAGVELDDPGAEAGGDDDALQRIRAGVYGGHRDAVRIADAVTRAERCADDAVNRQPRHALRNRLRLEPLDVDAKTPLHRRVLPKCVDVSRLLEQKQISVLMKIDRSADFVFESLEDCDRLDGQLHVGFVRKLVTHTAGITPGGSSAERRLTFDEDNVGQTETGEMYVTLAPMQPPPMMTMSEVKGQDDSRTRIMGERNQE